MSNHIRQNLKRKNTTLKIHIILSIIISSKFNIKMSLVCVLYLVPNWRKIMNIYLERTAFGAAFDLKYAVSVLIKE